MGLQIALSDTIDKYHWEVDESNTGLGTAKSKLTNTENGNTIEIKYSDWNRLIGGSAKAKVTINGGEEQEYSRDVKKKLREILEELGA